MFYFFTFVYQINFMKFKIAALLFLFSTFFSCNEEVKMDDDWTETMVIYGLLNQTETHQYIKINKGYIGKGDANAMAQVSDSINYSPSDLEVKLQRFYNGSQKGKDIFLHDTIIPNAQQGTFSKDNNIIYTTSAKLYGDSEYKLLVKNKKTGLECTSSVKMIDKILINAPPVIDFANSAGYVTINASWIARANSKLFQFSVFFVYKETKAIGDTVLKSIEWKFPSVKSNDENQSINQSLDGKAFYAFLHSNKDVYFPENGTKRFAYRIQFHLSVGGEELSNYYDVYKPSSNNNISNYTHDKTEYTNIKNGIGLFSCRYNATIVSCPLYYESIYELVNGELTKDLGFLQCDYCSQ